MFKNIKYINILLIGIVLMNFSCSNEVDINDDFSEINIVYGLLNQAETKHYVKFTKAFVTDDNVYLAAKDGSKSQYKPEELEMWLEEYSNGNFIKRISLDTVLITNKDTGVFYSPNQLVYATPEGVYLNQNREYRFKAKVKSTGTFIESSTTLVKDFSIIKPHSLVKYVDFGSKYPSVVEWYSAEDGKLYQLVIRYFYTDVYSDGKTEMQYIDWKFPQLRSENTKGGVKMNYEFLGGAFYNYISYNIPDPVAGQKRYSDSLHYFWHVANENFTIYMDVNQPSNSIVQERPAYSNVGNGLGIFASRYYKLRTFRGLNERSMDSLVNGSYTYHLGFEYRN